MNAVKNNSMWKKYALVAGGTWGLWLALTAIVYFLLLGPQNTLLAKLRKDFVSSNEEYSLAQMAGRPETQNCLEQKAQTLRQKTAYFLVPQDNPGGLILQISQLAARHQLQDFTSRVISSPGSKKTDKSKITEAWMELNFSGNFPQIASFINSLERNEPVVFIENIIINRGKEADGMPSANVQISYLTQKPEAQAKDASTKRQLKSKKISDTGK